MAFAVSEIRCNAFVDGIQVPVAEVVCRYPLAGIGGSTDMPECRLLIPLGARAIAGFGLQDASYIETLTSILYMKRIQVVAEIRNTRIFAGTSSTTPQNYNGFYTLFSGFITHVSYHREETSVFLALTCIHWLYRLQFSSILCGNIHPAAPSDFLINSFARLGAGSAGGLALQDIGQSLITPQDVMIDLWVQGIRRWFESLALQPRLGFGALGINTGSNIDALIALSSFLNTPGLPMYVDMFTAREVADTIAGRSSAGARNTLAGLAQEQTTFWSKLAGELAPLFFFAISPMPLYARVIPLIPSLRKPHVFLDAYDIFQFKLGKKIPVPIKGVGLIGNIEMYVGSGLRTSSSLYQSILGGAYVSTIHPNGIYIFRRAPPYLASSMAPANFTLATLTYRANFYARPGRGSFNRAAAAIYSHRRSLLRQVAKLVYTTESLADRVIEIRTPLLFTIAPGSTIQLRNPGANRINASGISNKWYGLVTEVQWKISAISQPPVAFTTYTLSYVRNETENDTDLGMNSHPLYGTIFQGSSMMNRM